MKRRRVALIAACVVAVIAAAAALGLPGTRLYWRVRSSNPVRRGAVLARNLGCFSCHGDLGRSGIPDPSGAGKQVPGWSGSLWMMYVKDDDEIREFILDGVSRRRSASSSAQEERRAAAISMPSYRGVVSSRDVDDLVASFGVLSGMKSPADNSPERRGYQLAESHECFSCHGPGGSGGLPNPRSFTGFVPGWYGVDFHDLVRDREEFESWVRTGSIPRLAGNRIASTFIRRQRLKMPAYRKLSAAEIDDLWSYLSWLARTRGGIDAPPRAF